MRERIGPRTVVRIVGSRALGIFPHHTVGSSTRIGVCPVVTGAPTVRLAEIVGAGCVAIAAAAAITMRLRRRAAASGRPPPAVRPHAGGKNLFATRNPAPTCFPQAPPPASAVGLPQGPVCIPTLIVARGCVCQTVLPPLHPVRSIRRPQGRGASRPIALHTCQLLGPTVPYQNSSAVRSRRPAASACASESHLLSPGGISGPAGHPARPTLASSRGSPVSMHRLARGQPSPSICWRNSERPVAARRESPF